MRARYHDPSVGRFVSEDPACNGDNWYIYCGSNPVNLIDNTGQEAELYDIAKKMLSMASIAYVGLYLKNVVTFAYGQIKNGTINMAEGIGGMYREISVGMALGQELGEAWAFARGTSCGLLAEWGVTQIVSGASLLLATAITAILLGDEFNTEFNPF